MKNDPFTIRPARPQEYAELGQLIVASYLELPGMPGRQDQPEYYARLLDVAGRAAHPAYTILAAVNEIGELLGSVDFINDMKHYASGGSASTVVNAAGIRLLVVKPAAQGRGIGKALTQACIGQAADLGRSKVILHTTKAMATAWRMYEGMGFQRCPALDFKQVTLEVFGFELSLAHATIEGRTSKAV